MCIRDRRRGFCRIDRARHDDLGVRTSAALYVAWSRTVGGLARPDHSLHDWLGDRLGLVAAVYSSPNLSAIVARCGTASRFDHRVLGDPMDGDRGFVFEPPGCLERQTVSSGLEKLSNG